MNEKPSAAISHFIVTDRKTDYLLPPSVDDWLNEDHLARFVVEVIDGLDITHLTRQYAGRGSKAHHPQGPPSGDAAGDPGVWLCKRRVLQPPAGAGNLRFSRLSLYCGGDTSRHDALASFRRRFLDELAQLFVQVLELAREMKLLKLGTVCLDGTKIHANASRHSEPPALPVDATPMQIMAHQLKTKAGRAAYALRKQTVETVFGIIKSVMGFRQFSLRGPKRAGAEWTLVCLAWNVKRMAVLRQNCAASG